MRPIKQRPWFIGLLSQFVVEPTLRSCGLTPDRYSQFDRAMFDGTAPFVPPSAGKHVLREDIEIPSSDWGTHNRGRLYSPVVAVDSATPIVIYCHGGGWMLGSPFKQPYDSLCANLCKRLECVVLSVDYRLAPEHPWPTPVEDVYAVLTWLATASGAEAIPLADRHRVVLMGDSAGGNLATCASLMWRDRQPSGVSVAHQVLLSPCVPTRPLLPSRIDRTRANGALLPAWLMTLFEEAYAGAVVNDKPTSHHAVADYDGTARAAAREELVAARSREPYFNPLAAVTLGGLPPCTGVIGGAEILHDEGVAYFQAARASGVDAEYRFFKDAYHAFVIFPFGQSGEAWDFVCERLRAPEAKLFALRGGATRLRGPPRSVLRRAVVRRRRTSPPVGTMPAWQDVADGRRVRFRSGRPTDALPIAATLLSNGMTPLGVDPSRFIVCESVEPGGGGGERVGFAQIRLLAKSAAPDASTYDARPGTADFESEADDDAWEDFERETAQRSIPTGLVLPWSAAYREMDERAALQRARRRARIAEAAASATPLWELASIFVESEWRGVGVGTALVRRLLETHERQGRSVATLYLLAPEPTAGWYEDSFGFHIVAQDRAPQQMSFEMAAREAFSAVLGNQLVCMRGGEDAAPLSRRPRPFGSIGS